ncbi:flagellar biosynthetic protein FliP, partial [Salmonella enterica subsp. enterica serovar Typhimurium]|nr:flagellar biosynthetic protein FliP [Salmonella enterica subsp. enterica serovar Typhimurium]
MRKHYIIPVLTAVFSLLLPQISWAANSDLLLMRDGHSEGWSLPVQTLVLLTSLTFLPACLLLM